MPVCSYLVLPAAGAVETLAERLAGIPGCEVVPAENRDLLILMTDTAGAEQEDALRQAIAGMDGVHALLLTFGAIDPETAADAAAPAPERGRRLPVLDSPGTCTVGEPGCPPAARDP